MNVRLFEKFDFVVSYWYMDIKRDHLVSDDLIYDTLSYSCNIEMLCSICRPKGTILGVRPSRGPVGILYMYEGRPKVKSVPSKY